jgi:hypothetical protein
MSRLVVRDGKAQYRLSQAKIKALKKKLRLAISAGHTLREMASSPHFYNGSITFQTLGRFVHEKNYVPASIETCRVLDIIADPNPYRSMPRYFQRTPEALTWFLHKRELVKGIADETRDAQRNKLPASSR